MKKALKAKNKNKYTEKTERGEEKPKDRGAQTKNNKRMAVPGSKQPSTQMPAWTRGKLEYRSIKLPKPRLTEQYFSIIKGGHFAMRRPLLSICLAKELMGVLEERGRPGR